MTNKLNIYICLASFILISCVSNRQTTENILLQTPYSTKKYSFIRNDIRKQMQKSFCLDSISPFCTEFEGRVGLKMQIYNDTLKSAKSLLPLGDCNSIERELIRCVKHMDYSKYNIPKDTLYEILVDIVFPSDYEFYKDSK